MYCNAPALVVSLFGIVGLGIIFLFDPTHDYPTTANNITLQPGESITVPIPTSATGFLKWAGSLISDPYLWATTTNGQLELMDRATTSGGNQLSPDVHIGMPAVKVQSTINASSGKAVVRNTGNTTLNTIVSFTMAPTPDKLGSAKTWWYMVFGFLQAIVGGIIATVPPGQQQSSSATSTQSSQPSIFTRIKNHLLAARAAVKKKRLIGRSTTLPTTVRDAVILPVIHNSSAATDVSKKETV